MGFKVKDFCIFEGKGHFTHLSGQVCQIELEGDDEPRFKVAFKNGNRLWAFTEWLRPVATVTEPSSDESSERVVAHQSPAASGEVVVSSKFVGVVILKEWMPCPDGQDYRAIKGEIQIVEAKNAIGFATARSESNWAAKVRGEQEEIYILGCQIRSCFIGQWQIDKTAYSVK